MAHSRFGAGLVQGQLLLAHGSRGENGAAPGANPLVLRRNLVGSMGNLVRCYCCGWEGTTETADWKTSCPGCQADAVAPFERMDDLTASFTRLHEQYHQHFDMVLLFIERDNPSATLKEIVACNGQDALRRIRDSVRPAAAAPGFWKWLLRGWARGAGPKARSGHRAVGGRAR